MISFPSIEKALLLNVVSGLSVGREWLGTRTTDGPDGSVPDTAIYDGRDLAVLRQLYRDGQEPVVSAVKALCETADAALGIDPLSVTQKPAAAPGGSLNDYYSLAKYWWPDATSPDGLPYVRRDGQVNPACYSTDYDSARLIEFTEAVHTLSLAAYLGGSEEHAQKAVELTDAWLLRPETRQTPHFDFAQTIPGQAGARAAAIIEARHLISVTEAARILLHFGALATAQYEQLQAWFATLLEWLRTGACGRAAAEASNNIAFWYDAQCLAYAEFIGDAKVVEHIVQTSIRRRLDEQVDLDGSMPAELRREKPNDYVAFSVAALAIISAVARKDGVDLWDYHASDGRSFEAVCEWLASLPASKVGRWSILAALAELPGAGDRATGDSPPDRVYAAFRLELGMLRRLSERRRQAFIAERQLRDQLTAELDARKAEAEELANLQWWEKARAARLEEQLAVANQRARKLVERAENAEQACKRLRRSTSWRITAPLREAGRAWRKVGRWIRGVPREDSSHLSNWATADGAEPLDAYRPSPELPPVPEPDIAALKAEYCAKGLNREPDTFILYRVIGNDLFPRHRKGQSRDNVRFILDHEPVLPGCEKRWVVNRIVDPDEEMAILALLEERGQSYLRIPFDWDEYRRVPWDFENFPEPGFFLRGAFLRFSLECQERAETQARRHRNNYVMNNNGARNAALADGRGRAKWVLPWDGNCFLTEAAWSELVASVREKPYLRYFVTPMARITDNQALLEPGFLAEAEEEPQILFRRDAAESFNEAFPYGRRSKVELFWRLGVPGNWDSWQDDLWDLERPRQRSAEAGQFAQAGWVARLFSGQTKLEVSGSGTIRAFARNFAIRETLDALDEMALLRAWDPLRLTAYDEAAIKGLGSANSEGQTGELLARLLGMADEALGRSPPSVVDKTTLPPSGDVHDYWHPAPYWWPNSETSDGLPYVCRDGERVPGTQMHEPESDQYDRTRLQGLFDDTTAVALAWQATGNPAYAEHGARMVRRWFVDPQTRMNPNLRHAQVRLGHNNNEGASRGIIEFKDLYYFLDAVRLLARAEALNPEEQDALSDWLRAYLDWLENSEQGQGERQANNHHGTCYDLQVGAIAAYLGDARLLLDTLRTSQERLVEQFDSEGRQPHEMTRTLTAHYTAFNLQCWVNLATLAECCGHDLWHVTTSDGRGLRRAFEWMAPYFAGTDWAWPQMEPFDRDRYLPLYFAACERYGSVAGLNVVDMPARLAAKPLFPPHDGIKPFWNLGV